MCLVMVSGAGVSAIAGVGVVAECNVGKASGSSVHPDSAAAVAAPSTTITAIKRVVFRVPSDAIRATLIRTILQSSAPMEVGDDGEMEGANSALRKVC